MDRATIVAWLKPQAAGFSIALTCVNFHCCVSFLARSGLRIISGMGVSRWTRVGSTSSTASGRCLAANPTFTSCPSPPIRHSCVCFFLSCQRDRILHLQTVSAFGLRQMHYGKGKRTGVEWVQTTPTGTTYHFLQHNFSFRQNFQHQTILFQSRIAT